MIVEVRGSIDDSIILLKRRLEKDGIFRLIRIRDTYPKASERRKAKNLRAALRRKRDLKKQRDKEGRR